MKLKVYKGFDESFLNSLDEDPLIGTTTAEKTNVLSFDKKHRKQLNVALLSMDGDDTSWVTYEEYSLIKTEVDSAIQEDNLQVEIYRNNLYPDYYPISFNISDDLAQEIEKCINDELDATSEDCQRFLKIYNTLVNVDGRYFGSFYNFEYGRNQKNVAVRDFYPQDLTIGDSQDTSDYHVALNEDVDSYLRDLLAIQTLAPKQIGLSSTEGEVSQRLEKSLLAYCRKENIRVVHYHEDLSEDFQKEQELINIAQNDINIQGFTGFRKIQFYKNPDISKETIDISQGKIIRDIIKQAESAYDDATGNKFRDIFITASTGAGKSVMFQIPAVYLAKKYHRLTIIIEPVKALMQDQKERLNQNGYFRVETFNSDLITQAEKETVLKRVKGGEVDLLYLSPETLLSYSMETLIGDREIGLMIVDEAHIVTTWGVGFRPDYWYLGGYINKLRNQIQTGRNMKRKIYHFPICAFTATAINGGIDDSVGDTIISLYMENPIKYIGYVKRDDIHFEIVQHEQRKLPKAEYEENKTQDLDKRLKHWLSHKIKTVVYFPYASFAYDASKGIKELAGLSTDSRIGMYIGRNIEAKSDEAFSEEKREAFEKFRKGDITVMYATKAFGMGVDVDDIENVYHYAPTGNLSDYVQEIGRAARKKGMEGVAITDTYYNDINFMNVLFGMSQIRQYQIMRVLSGIYDTYRNKNEARSFLISPESFAYIFSGSQPINQLKTSLLMLEKDFYDKYNFKVLISRPQSIFTKAYVVIKKDHVDDVINSKYGKAFKYIQKGRYQEKQWDGSVISDTGDVYSINLKMIWEQFYPNISFPQFKYFYFNPDSSQDASTDIMPTVREFFSPRQKVSIKANGELLLNEIRDAILKDFEYIANALYAEFAKKYFTIEEFTNLISKQYGRTKARLIANSLFDMVDPQGRCVKHRRNEKTGFSTYSLSNGNFKEFMRRPIIKSRLISNFSNYPTDEFEGYLSLMTDDSSSVALKLLSIFEYISYEVVGGEEPEIFIRLNDPNKVRQIVMGRLPYSNGYVTKAGNKHKRDVRILRHFLNGLSSDKERWDFIENYFLGYDVLEGVEDVKVQKAKLSKTIDREHSYPTNQFKKWNELKNYIDDQQHQVLDELANSGVPIPEYLATTLKKSKFGDDILMSWPSKDTIICNEDVAKEALTFFDSMGWHVYKIFDIDYDKLKKDLS